MIFSRTPKIAKHTILLRNCHGNTFYRHTLEGTADDASVQARYLFDDYAEAQEASFWTSFFKYEDIAESLGY